MASLGSSDCWSVHYRHPDASFCVMANSRFSPWGNRGTVADKRDRLFEALLGRARRSSIRMVILFIDEAHELEELHYQWLRNISNELDAAGYRLFCLLVGQQELATKRESLFVEGMEQIVSRFMTEIWTFSGLRKVADLQSVFNGFDLAVYPPDNGRPFLDYFAPLAYAQGWKLEGLCLAPGTSLFLSRLASSASDAEWRREASCSMTSACATMISANRSLA